ncbi:MAG: CHAT domain-containing protein, partial [Acidobacteria bacterium]|nr:CHAT domain-containing protein [Acidobacteriota bacterium]
GTWIAAMEQCETAEAWATLLREAPANAASEIQGRLVALLYSDRGAAQRMREMGLAYAALHPDDAAAGAYARRGAAHVCYAEGAYALAVEGYEAAAGAFAGLGLGSEQARTLSSGLQSLILLSRYDQADQWAVEAERIFLQMGDLLRLARLDSNVGNIYFRQDRARDAVARYRRALEGFRSVGEPKDIAAVLSNLAVAHTNLGEFREALSAYNEARDHCQEHGLTPLIAQADYNIAYLYFLRGDYSEARRRYQISRQHGEEQGDAYHLALCDLDEAEMCLELNLTEEGDALARRAARGFFELGMRYERAKSLVSLAVAGSHRGNFRRSDRVLCHARELFALEGNEVWPALIDLLRAILALRAGRFQSASRLSALAWKTLAHTRMPGRAAHCQILRGRLWLREGLADRARATAREALARLGDDAPPSLRFHAKLLEGEAEEMQGRWREALACYEAARSEIEDLRRRLDTEDLRISLLKDKLAVYEGLISLYLESPIAAQADSVDRALMLVQQAKSRSLADRLLRIGSAAADEETPAMRGLREDLNWCYRQIEIAVLMQRAGSPLAPVSELKAKARWIETELLHARAGAGEPSESFLEPFRSSEALRAAIPEETALLEYFESRGSLYLFVVTGERVRLVRLGPMGPILHALKLFQFQLGRYRMHPDSHATAGGIAVARYHLASLHELLLGPAVAILKPYRRWIVAPHRHLHGVPFSALEADGRCVFDDVEVIHAPSASVYAACRNRKAPPTGGAYVMAVPDGRNPNIESEASQVAGVIPQAALLSGSAASTAAFREAAGHCSILHLVAHGTFRRDNPMFSSIELADGRLSLFDLSRTQLNAGLVVLSACHTGATVSVGGDELLGLMRGFLSSGAHNLLVSLWDVNDRSTMDFMVVFYQALEQGQTLASAIRQATLALRARHPHPYYWAPFILVGTS